MSKSAATLSVPPDAEARLEMLVNQLNAISAEDEATDAAASSRDKT